MQSELSVDDVRAFFDEAYREVLEDKGVEGTHYPEQMRIGGNAEMMAK